MGIFSNIEKLSSKVNDQCLLSLWSSSLPFEGTKNWTAKSRSYPRPGRTGSRIEQARLQHGTTSNHPRSDFQLNPPAILKAESSLSSSAEESWISIHLLAYYFQGPHYQCPILDPANFVTRFNSANGDIKIMVSMANGGDGRYEAAVPSAPGLSSLTWEGTKESKVSSFGSCETLIACMQASASNFSDAPSIFGPSGCKYLQAKKPFAGQSSFLTLDSKPPPTPSAVKKPPKGKQGVACDPCRLRRVKCDFWESADGVGCSRCRVKSIQCSTAFIQKRVAKISSLDSDASSVSAGEASASTDDFDPQSMASLGKLRRPTCAKLLDRALNLCHKHKILERPSVEAIQCLAVLVPVLAANNLEVLSRGECI